VTGTDRLTRSGTASVGEFALRHRETWRYR